MSEVDFVVATIRPWNIAEYHSTISRFPGRWHLISDPSGLTFEKLAVLQPRYVFFPHWSHKVPREILQEYKCVCP